MSLNHQVRIFIITTEEPFYTVPILQSIFESYGNQIVGVALVDGFISKRRILSSLFVYGLFRFIKMSILTVLAGLKGGAVKKFLRDRNINCLSINNVNSENFIQQLKNLRIDVLISNNCPQLIEPAVLSTAKIMPINLHLGALPKYRGVFPIWRAWVNHESHFGVTVHKMDPKFDNGEIICQEMIKINPEENLFDLYPKAFTVGSKMLCDVIKSIETNQIKFIKNDRAEGTYYSFPTPSEVIKLHKKRINKAVGEVATG